MKTPSSPNPVPLVLGPSPSSSSPPSPTSPTSKAKPKGVQLEPAESLQKLVSFDLKEEGNHVLAVTVTYSESTTTSNRIRTFRKLYQFQSKPSLVVRTKTTLVSRTADLPRRWTLEAQLENCGEEQIVLEHAVMEMRDGWKSQGFNWDSDFGGNDRKRPVKKPLLKPGDVEQVCFVVEELLDVNGKGREMETVSGSAEQRYIFGILSLEWRGPMGNRGFLSTGLLGSRAG